MPILCTGDDSLLVMPALQPCCTTSADVFGMLLTCLLPMDKPGVVWAHSRQPTLKSVPFVYLCIQPGTVREPL